MADYANKSKEFDQRMKQGVPKDAAQKGLAQWKTKQAALNKKSSSDAPATGQKERERSRGGMTR